MYWPYDFTVGASTMTFTTGVLFVKAKGGQMSYRPTSITNYIQTIDGSYIDPYGSQQIVEQPQTVTFQVIYKSGSTSDIHASAISYYQSTIKNIFFGKSGTLRGYANKTTPLFYSCTARLANVYPVLPQQGGSSSHAFFNFTFVQKTAFV